MGGPLTLVDVILRYKEQSRQQIVHVLWDHVFWVIIKLQLFVPNYHVRVTVGNSPLPATISAKFPLVYISYTFLQWHNTCMVVF